MLGRSWFCPRFLDKVCPLSFPWTLEGQMTGFATSVAGALGPGLLGLCALIRLVPSSTTVGTGQWSLATFALPFDSALFPCKQQVLLVHGLRWSILWICPLVCLEVQVVDGLLLFPV